MDLTKDYKLSFATVSILKDDLAEIIVDEGVIVNEMMVAECHDFIREILQPPLSLLINKKHAYSYTFEAQKNIANIEEINAIAMVYETNGGLIASKMLINFNKPNNRNIKHFRDREEALKWISDQ